LNKLQPAELKIIQAIQAVDVEEFETTDSEDTLSVLHRYIDEFENNYDKSRIKSIINNLYQEVHQLV
jgi:hypothetical protein